MLGQKEEKTDQFVSHPDESAMETAFYLDLRNTQSLTKGSAIDANWRKSMLRSKRCCGQGCAGVRSRFYGEPVNVPLVRRTGATIMFGPMALIVSIDLYRKLCPEMPEHVQGQCYLTGSEQIIEEYVTVYSSPQIAAHVRGGIGSNYRLCPHCSSPFVEGDGTESQPEYLLSRAFDGHAVAQVGNHGSFVVTREFASTIDWTDYGDLVLYKYDVLDRPIDGARLIGDPIW